MSLSPELRQRIDSLLRACAELGTNPRLMIVGDGPERAAMQSLAKEIYPSAEFIGAKHGMELKSYFAQADLFVLPGTGGLAVQEAMSYGLAPRICDDPRAAAFEVAREIAGKSPDAIRAAKRMLNNLSVDPGPALLAESVEQQKLLGSPNQTEAVRANMEKRAPKFAEAG